MSCTIHLYIPHYISRISLPYFLFFLCFAFDFPAFEDVVFASGFAAGSAGGTAGLTTGALGFEGVLSPLCNSCMKSDATVPD